MSELSLKEKKTFRSLAIFLLRFHHSFKKFEKIRVSCLITVTTFKQKKKKVNFTERKGIDVDRSSVSEYSNPIEPKFEIFSLQSVPDEKDIFFPFFIRNTVISPERGAQIFSQISVWKAQLLSLKKKGYCSERGDSFY